MASSYKPRLPSEGDWVVLLENGETGVVEKLLDDGERLWVRLPSKDNWPFPRHVHVPTEKVKRIKPPKPPAPEIVTEEALL